MRKINAVVSLMITFLLLFHAISNAVWMLSMGSIAKHMNFLAWVLTGLMAIHAFISIDLAVSAHVGTEKRKCKSYPQMNLPTIVQRASGVLMVIFTGLHIAGTIGYLEPPKAVHAILPPLFFTMVLIHVAVSTSKAFITLGIGNAKFIKTVDIIAKAFSALTLIAVVIGFYLYLW